MAIATPSDCLKQPGWARVEHAGSLVSICQGSCTYLQDVQVEVDPPNSTSWTPLHLPALYQQSGVQCHMNTVNFANEVGGKLITPGHKLLSVLLTYNKPLIALKGTLDLTAEAQKQWPSKPSLSPSLPLHKS